MIPPLFRSLAPVLLLCSILAAGLLASPVAEAMQAAVDPATQVAQAVPQEAVAPPDTDLRGRFDFAFDKVAQQLADLVAKLPLLAIALLIVLLASWLGSFVSRRLHLLRLRTNNPYMNGLIGNVLRVVVTLFGVVIALNLLNATALVSAVLGSAGVVGLVLGFAFKDIAENYVAGILLSLRQPFSPGDHVVIDGNEGKVVALLSRTTTLMTMDGNELRLPNALVFKAIVLNYSRNPKRRFDFSMTIDAGSSIRQAQSLGLAQVAGVEGVLAEPGPSWSVQEFSPAGIVLRFFGWVNQRESDLGKVRSESIRRVKAAFAQAGIESPRTTYHVLSARAPSIEPPLAAVEPINGGGADTSVNRDIDKQLAQAQQASDDGTNLLEPRTGTP
jgi:small conductance mechanosensitive channel